MNNMQNRYIGDIGDFAKYGLIRAITGIQKIGIAWYLYPDESHNKGGRRIGYLDKPDEHRWRETISFDTP